MNLKTSGSLIHIFCLLICSYIVAESANAAKHVAVLIQTSKWADNIFLNMNQISPEAGSNVNITLEEQYSADAASDKTYKIDFRKPCIVKLKTSPAEEGISTITLLSSEESTLIEGSEPMSQPEDPEHCSLLTADLFFFDYSPDTKEVTKMYLVFIADEEMSIQCCCDTETISQYSIPEDEDYSLKFSVTQNIEIYKKRKSQLAVKSDSNIHDIGADKKTRRHRASSKKSAEARNLVGYLTIPDENDNRRFVRHSAPLTHLKTASCELYISIHDPQDLSAQCAPKEDLKAFSLSKTATEWLSQTGLLLQDKAIEMAKTGKFENALKIISDLRKAQTNDVQRARYQLQEIVYLLASSTPDKVRLAKRKIGSLSKSSRFFKAGGEMHQHIADLQTQKFFTETSEPTQ